MTEPKETAKETSTPGLLAVVMLRGKSKAGVKAIDTLQRLHLSRANQCTIVPADPTYTGMLKSADNFLTWGNIDSDTLTKLIVKRGFDNNGSRLEEKDAKSIAQRTMKEKKLDQTGVKPCFRLSPPSGGLRSVKMRYPKGDMGPRGEKINELLLRML